MDRTKLNIAKQIDASTLVEVIIAMVTIVVIFGIAMLIYSNVIRSSVSVKKFKAQSILNELAQKASVSTGAVQNDSYVIEELRIEQKVSPYRDDPNLEEIALSAYDDNQQLLATLKQVIVTAHE